MRRHAWSSRKKKIWRDRCRAEPQWQRNPPLIRSHYISAKFWKKNFKLQTSCFVLFFVKPNVCTPNVHASLWQPWRGSQWITGIDLRAAEEQKCSGSRTGRRFITTIGVQYNRCKILDRCTKEQVLYSTFQSSTFMNKKKNIRKGSYRRELFFHKNCRPAGKHLLTNTFFVCLLKIDPKNVFNQAFD